MAYYTRSRANSNRQNSIEVKKMEQQLSLPESPAQNPLLLPEVVSIIFKLFANDNDIESLKQARLVCKTWKQCVFDALKNNPNLVLIVSSGEIVECEDDSVSANLLLPKSIKSCFKNLTQVSNIPLKLFTNNWSPEVEIFVKQFYPSLVSFHIFGRSFKGPQGFLIHAAQNLTELHINSPGEYNIGTMRRLKLLKLKSGQISPMNSSAMPNLTSIIAHENFIRGQTSRPLLTATKCLMKTVSNLELEEFWGPLGDDMHQVALDLVSCFPNLRSLSWKTKLSREINCLKAAPAIFSSLGNLTIVKFSVDIGIEHEVFRYISGIHPSGIPNHEESWKTCLRGNNISIRNLPHLRKFELAIRNELFPLRFASKETRFLFQAAFGPMQHLKDLSFHYVILGDSSVTSAWAAEAGRHIRMVHYCRATGTNVEYQT